MPSIPGTHQSHRGQHGRRVTARLVSMIVALACAGLAGCSTKKGSGVDGYNALIRSQQEALALQQLQEPMIHVHGAVQKPVVAWRENLTLAETLLEAGYRHTLSPRAIRVTRQGRVYNIDVRRLLRGTENPVLEPGDVVEVVR